MTASILTAEQPEWEVFYLTFTSCFAAGQVERGCDCASGGRRHTFEALKLFPRFSTLRTMQYLQHHGGTCDCQVHETVILIEATREMHLKQAAVQGDVPAQEAFAMLCLNGTHSYTMGKEEQTYVREGLAWLKSAANLGSARAELLLKGFGLAGLSYV
jgi:hypothetical protein